MILHMHKEYFNTVVREVSRYLDLLAVIIEKDYNKVTKAMMFKEVSYEEAIKKIIDSEIFCVEKSECGVYYG